MALPTIRPGMKISFSLESLIGLIGGVVFCTMTYMKLDTLDARTARIEKALGITGVDRVPGNSTGFVPAARTQP